MGHSVRTFSPRTWLTMVIVGLVLLAAFAFVREYVRNMDIATELERMNVENQSLNAEHLASLQLITQLSTETAVEGDARTKLNLAKEGETMYVVTDTAKDEQMDVTDSRAVAADPALSNPVKWLYYFFAPDAVKEDGTL
jgi:cell division protein FtsB